MKSTSIKNPILLFLAAFIWGTAFVAQSVGMDYIGPFAFNGVRNILGFLVLLPVIAILGKTRKKAQTDVRKPTAEEKKKARRILLIAGLCCGVCLFVASMLQQIGIKYTPVGKAGFLTACYIVLVPIFGLFLKKKCSPLVWIAVVFSLIGLYLLCIKDGFSIAPGDIYVICCAVVFALHILIIDHFSPMVDGVKLSCIQFLVCGILSLIFAAILEPNTTPQIILSAWKPIAYCGIFSSGIAYTCQIVGQKGMNPTIASLIMSLESCISVLAGWVLLGQQLSSREGIGCVLMFAAIILAQLPVEFKSRKQAGQP